MRWRDEKADLEKSKNKSWQTQKKFNIEKVDQMK